MPTRPRSKTRKGRRKDNLSDEDSTTVQQQHGMLGTQTSSGCSQSYDTSWWQVRSHQLMFGHRRRAARVIRDKARGTELSESAIHEAGTCSHGLRPDEVTNLRENRSYRCGLLALFAFCRPRSPSVDTRSSFSLVHVLPVIITTIPPLFPTPQSSLPVHHVPPPNRRRSDLSGDSGFIVGSSWSLLSVHLKSPDLLAFRHCPKERHAKRHYALAATCPHMEERLYLHVTDAAVFGAKDEQGDHAHVRNGRSSVEARVMGEGHPCETAPSEHKERCRQPENFVLPRPSQTGIKNRSGWNDLLFSPMHAVERTGTLAMSGHMPEIMESRMARKKRYLGSVELCRAVILLERYEKKWETELPMGYADIVPISAK
ncbi:hypothetical protein BJY52DRAFT_1228100 [Lactarius psammicola]|nr:hypothetical protein BJY52DRAFT_1228100 [Lactarius psammicola]